MKARRVIPLVALAGAVAVWVMFFSLRSPLPKVRLRVIEGVTDQAMLARIATTDNNRDVRKAAAGKLEDQAALAQIATTDNEPSVREAATSQLLDPIALATIATTDTDTSVRRKAVILLEDSDVLGRVATGDSDARIRLAALEKLTDPPALAQVATTDRDESLRELAIQRLDDQALLSQVVNTLTNAPLRHQALAKLNGESLLGLANSAADLELRREAIESVTEPGLIARFARSDTNNLLSRAVLTRVTDQAALAELATSAHAALVRQVAVEALGDEDQALLAGIATQDSSAGVRRAAVAKLASQDQPLLAGIAASDPAPEVRRAAIGRLDIERLSAEAEQAATLQRLALLDTVELLLRAAREIPAQHRARLLTELTPLAARSSETSWVAKFGYINAVTIDWRSVPHSYPDGGGAYGEEITLTVSASEVAHPITAQWRTNFPAKAQTSPTWIDAVIDLADLQGAATAHAE